MSGRDKLFVGGTLASTALIPGLLLATRPFGEARETLGLLCGWGLALVVVVPSYWLLVRALRQDEPRRFYAAFMGGTMGRFFVSLLAILLFAVLVSQAPVRSFLVSFFLGYMVLTGLEVTLALGAARGRHA